MIEFRGWFKDINDNDVVVEITKQSEEELSFEIGENGIYFAGDSPVTITQDVENEFQIILSKQCTINLITDDYMGDYLFADNARDVEVTVQRYVNQGNQTKRFVLFNGFLEPITFSQGYAHKLETFTLTANDYLGTLENLKYKDITLTDFDDSKQDATNRSFKDILYEIIPSAKIWYDQSKGVDENSIQTLFDDLGVFDVYMIGETYDDLWTQKEVLEEMLRYLNLHIAMNGSDFYLFDWDSMMAGETINWLNLGTKRVKRGTYQEVQLTKEFYAGDDTNVTVADVYNQIQVTDELESLEDLIKSPLDSDNLQPLYPKKSWYMTEFISEGEGKTAREAFENIINDLQTDFEDTRVVNWFIQPMYNPEWKLNLGDGRTIEDLVERDETGMAINAYKLPLYANEHRLTPLILNCGSVEKNKANDNSPIPKIDMDPYLFISLKGNDADPSTNAGFLEPTPGKDSDATYFQQHSPILEYVSKISGGTFSPVDDETTNYIVFSGKMILQPVVWECDRWFNYTKKQSSVNTRYMQPGLGFHISPGIQFFELWDHYIPSGYEGLPFTTATPHEVDNHYEMTYLPVASKNNNDGRFYTRRFYKDSDSSILFGDDDVKNTDHSQDPYPYYQTWDFKLTKDNLHMWTDDPGRKYLQYQYSYAGNSHNQSDQLSKIPVLECELIIGDKRCVETPLDEAGKSEFVWIDKNSGLDCSFIDDNGDVSTYLKTTFSLGIDPKKDDWIIGQEHNIQNTIDALTMDLNDPVGTAIPIKRSDKLSGKVDFRILGPVNNVYFNKITRRHPTWFRHTKWNQSQRAILSHLESIIIKDFEAKLYTSGASDAPDSDLIYVSDETDRYISKNDDTTFKFITQLSSQECLAKGIKPSINQNAVLNIKTNIPVSSLYNRLTGDTAKAEEHFVDQYYRIFSKPKVLMQTTIHDGLGVDFESICDTDYMEKPSYILGIDQDLKMATMTIKIKEI